MKPKTLTILSVVTILLLAGGLLLYFGITERFDERMIWVVDPKSDIEPNTKITKDMLKQVPKKIFYLPSGTIMDDSMIGKYAKNKLLAGREINSREVDNEPAVDTGLGFNLKPGERIVSVSADNSNSVGGMISKGHYVDVVWIAQRESEKRVAVPLFNHLEVLDVRNKYGASISAKENKSDKSSSINFISAGGQDLRDQYPLEIVLRVTEEQERAILLAKDSGTVALAINPNMEDSNVLPPLTTDDMLSGVIFRE